MTKKTEQVSKMFSKIFYDLEKSYQLYFTKYTVCVFFSWEQKVNNSGEFSPN